MIALDLVIFDLAGTTVKDNGEVAGAFTTALEEGGIQVTPDQLRAVRGSSKRQAVLDLIPAGPDKLVKASTIYSSFRRHLSESYTDQGVQPIDGAEQAFRLVHDLGAKVALNTGFDRDITGLLLASLGWNEAVVDAVVCGDEVTQGRPAPYLIFHAMEATGARDVHRVMAAGDTLLDLKAGYAAGVRWNVGVLSGAHDRQTLERGPYTHLFPSVADLAALLTDL